MVALNAQSFPIRRLIALSRELGRKSRHLRLMTRQDLIHALTRSYGRVLVGRAAAGLMKARPDWSAKAGLSPWQLYAGAAAAGAFIGGAVAAPRETATCMGLMFSLFFLIAILLRLLALVNLTASKPARRMVLLSDAELPRYTVFVPLFKEAAILPHLAEALSALDYPGIMAQTPVEI
jgi:glycosyltransferase XagB